MRAGSLSDPRVVALLGKHFVPVVMTELVTRDLIEDPRDVALLEKYDRERAESGRNPGLQGGEREVFLTPDGELVDVFLSLHHGSRTTEHQGHEYHGQFGREERASPDAAVAHFFESASLAYERSFGALPRDWRRLLDGTAPEVARVRAARIPASLPSDDGLTLRLWVRADVLMYEGLVGYELVHLDASEARSLLPERLRPGARSSWPRALFVRLARSAYPRGAGVLVALADSSVHGAIETTLLGSSSGKLRGRFAGSFRLEPATDAERSRRRTYKPYRRTRGELIGDFVWNEKDARFESFRLVSRNGSSTFSHGRSEEQSYQLGVELLGRD